MKFYLVLGLSILAFVALGFLAYWFWLIPLNLAFGFLLYLAIAHPLDYLERRGLSSLEASTLLFLSGTILILAFVLYVSIPLFDQVNDFVQTLPALFDKLNVSLSALEQTFPFIPGVIDSIRAKLLDPGWADPSR